MEACFLNLQLPQSPRRQQNPEQSPLLRKQGVKTNLPKGQSRIQGLSCQTLGLQHRRRTRTGRAAGPDAPRDVPQPWPLARPRSCPRRTQRSATAAHAAAAPTPDPRRQLCHFASPPKAPRAFLAWQLEQQKLLLQPPRAMKLRNVIET